MKKPVISPFTVSELHTLDVENPYSKPGTRLAIRMPNGKILLNFNDGTKYSDLCHFAKILGGEVVLIKGTWTFVPDTIEKAEENE